MTPRRAATLLAVLLIAAPFAHPGRAPAAPERAAGRSQAAGGARARLERAVRPFRAARTFDLEGVMSLTIESGGRTQRSETRFRIAGAPGGRLHESVSQGGQRLRTLADGRTVVTALEPLRQWMERSRRLPAADSLGPDLQPGTPGAWVGAFLGELRTLADSVASVRVLRTETLAAGGRSVPCDVLEVRYRHARRPDGATPGPRTVWLARADGRVVRYRTTFEPPSGAPAGSSQTHEVHYERAVVAGPRDPQPSLPDSLFAFRGGDEWRKVRRFQMPGQEQEDLTGQVAGDFTLPDLEGASHTLSAHRGRVVLLDFWASWCGPCRMTMPVIDKLARELKAAGLVVYSINVREPRNVADGYIKKRGYQMPVLLDQSGEVGAKYKVNGIPALVIVGKDGKVAAHMIGAHGEEDLREALAEAGVR